MSELLIQEKPAEIEVPNPMGNLLQLAIEKGASLDQIDRLIAMQERLEAGQARKAYLRAMADFKNEAIVITKDKTNKQYDSKYSSIGNFVGTVTPFLSKHGLSAEWELDQSEGIKVGCKITHCLGHSGETKWMKVPLDTSGAKNPLQQIKSSVTYAKISTFEMASGLASTEGNADDDGNGAGGGTGMEAGEFDRYTGLIENAGSIESLKQVYLAACGDAVDKKGVQDKAAVKSFAKIKDARYKELHNATR